MNLKDTLQTPGWERSRLVRSIIAVCCCLAAVTLLALQITTGKTTVVVAIRPIYAGEQIAASDIKTTKLPAAAVSPGAITDPEQISERLAIAHFEPGQQLTEHNVMSLSKRSFTAQDGSPLQLTPIQVADPTVANLVKPGDIVSVLALDGDKTARQIATGALVVTASEKPEQGIQNQAVLLALPPAGAAAVAKAALASSLGIVITGNYQAK